MDLLPDHWDSFSVRREEAGPNPNRCFYPLPRRNAYTSFITRRGGLAVRAGARFRALVLHRAFLMVPSPSPNQDTHHRQFCGLQAQT